MKRIEEYFDLVQEPRYSSLIKFHEISLKDFNTAKGSKSKHQAWEGGYRDHLEQCMTIAEKLYELGFEFSFESVLLVIYFHDIEKMFRVKDGLFEGRMDELKTHYYTKALPLIGIPLTNDELNALQYIHGEGEDYCERRLMGPLAAFCHGCDIISARCFHDRMSLDDGRRIIVME